MENVRSFNTHTTLARCRRESSCNDPRFSRESRERGGRMRHGDSRYARGCSPPLSLSLRLFLSPAFSHPLSLSTGGSEARGIHARGKRRYVDYSRGQTDADRKTVAPIRRRRMAGEEEGTRGEIKEGIIAAFSTAQLHQSICVTSADRRSWLFSLSLSFYLSYTDPFSAPRNA